MTFALAPELAPLVRPGVLRLGGVRVVDREPLLDRPMAAAEEAIRAMRPEFDGAAAAPSGRDGAAAASSEIALQPADLRSHIDLVRTMYKRVGIDPTKRRPSSEALLRRVLKGDALPRINSVVDVCNWCSFEFQLPYGLYDAARIDGDVVLRLGRPGESYAGIRKDDVHVGGRIALADAAGPFGNPTSDSARTMITPATTRVLLVVYAPRGVAEARLAGILEMTASRMRDYAGANVEASQLL